MGNVESQNGDHAYYGTQQGHLSRKHMSRSLRLPNKQSRRSRPTSSSAKAEHRNSEASTRSSSTPSIPQSMAESDLEPFNEKDALGKLADPTWAGGHNHVALNLRPVSFHDHLGDPVATPASEDSVEADTVVQEDEDEEDEDSHGGLYTREATYLQRMNDVPREGGSFKKKRSKSADMWREDSLEFSLSDLSQEHLTSTEEIIDGLEDFPDAKQGRDAAERANSLDELCTQKTPVLRGKRNRYKHGRNSERVPGMETPDQMLSPTEDDGNGYGAYTLPCRRSHCLSEGLPSQQATICSRMQGRRAQTTHVSLQKSHYFFKEIEICPKVSKVIQFDRAESYVIGYGFSVVVVDEDGTQQLHVTDVKVGGLAAAKGLRAGDEILQLNGKAASALELSDMQAAFALPSLALSVSTLPAVEPSHLCHRPPRRTEHDDTLCTDIFSQNQEEILDEGAGLAPESPDDGLGDGSILTSDSPGDSLEDELDADTSPKSTEQVATFCRSLHDMNPGERPASSSSSSSSSCTPSPVSPIPSQTTLRQLSDAVKLRHVICELVETERTYVKDLKWLIEKYLTPLQKESFLTQDELDVLFGNVVEMLEFQVEFLKTLEDGTRLVPDLEKLEQVDQFKKVLFSLGGSFLYYADRFKIYSAFCASHTKVPKVIARAKTDPDFKAFLDERNPRRQHSFTLESYLIKPIQRVLKYPLLLRELHSLTDPESDEHYHLDVAMKAMNKVASHINEMQKIHEEYGAVFDQLISEQSGERKEVADLSMGDLLLHATVAWINPPPSLVKGKKEPELAVFVFRTALVFVYKDSSKHKKKIGASHRVSTADEKDPIRFRHMIPTDDLQLRNLGNADGTAMCEIVHVRSESEGRPERTFHLCCSSPDSKKDFLKTVHSILRDKQRRQLLKTESLPPNQQYIPFGGKRLCALKGARPTMNRAVSAPTRTLGRRKVVRNRFTIDRDVIFDDDSNQSTDHEQDSPTLIPEPVSQHEPAPHSHNAPLPPKDTERWVEQQFDHGRYNNQVKETDILSDDDDYCKSVRGPSAEPSAECPLGALSLGQECENGEPHRPREDALSPAVVPERTQGPLKLTPLRKQCAVEGVTEHDHEVIWVRRDDFGSPNGDVF
ncbi:LOW QUALITY PROTEIN: T-lymphoma invasion and metastasis-inducing protein 1-like [Alosa sapidissima]|uniref:LOW QUALITY PROTEIN: T-lymphoma invasion and metastasis-inducing protein 1-like n=1 Tax=Alosa sapidissima TaxID=34773 RepID=UPI001C08711E|nr:LOW QUALITY PROTEIN: T-lymphoma invasion and metastasis-inducing protein 1-like [Alosa sapidissima]